ncbi:MULTISPECIES: diacylglycerol kinase [Clostridium]|uniref:Phosphatase PAP2 family protein n=1 Tax=Clostridium senegalense TaxID=1465809 RepID=A0A6M0H1C4_9CLOT|nr:MULTISPECIES: diacylglycerol kinase [Clostridium]NEU03422.1 phosphatase PAP2 family protein [Clostridium senegalense]
MKVKKILDSFNYAIEGIIYSIRTQRNMRIHVIAAIMVLTLCFFYDLSKVELLITTITITMVIVAEMINTAVEAAIDATTNYYHPLAKISKNVAAGAVLITAFNAVIVAYVIFWDRIRPFSINVLNKIRNCDPHMIFLILVIVSILTLVVKAIFGEGTPLRGGMPSGHSVISFSIATTITLISNNSVIMVLSYFLALIVAQSRVDAKIHSVLEVAVGAMFGILVTLLLYNFFS